MSTRNTRWVCPHCENTVLAPRRPRIMELNGANLELSCMLGQYHASIGMKKLHSYSDERGEYAEVWHVTRYHKDASEAVRRVFEAAMLARPEPLMTIDGGDDERA